jgi:hypothetical protein
MRSAVRVSVKLTEDTFAPNSLKHAIVVNTRQLAYTFRGKRNDAIGSPKCR